MSSIKDVNIYLKEVSAEVASHNMASHSIFPTQTLPNSLCSPFSYLKPKLETKKMKQLYSDMMDTTEVVY
jgi:hypothetical protein